MVGCSHMVLADMKKLGHRRCLLVVVNRATCFARASGSFVERSARPFIGNLPTLPPRFSRCHFLAPACYISIKQALTGDCGTPGRHTFRCKLAGKDKRWRWRLRELFFHPPFKVSRHVGSVVQCFFFFFFLPRRWPNWPLPYLPRSRP